MAKNLPPPPNAWHNFLYDAFLWLLSVLVDLFFREVHPRSSWKVPRKGPVIIVAAPHANQFVDPLILMRVLRNDAHRRVCWLIAEKSMKRLFIGTAATIMGSVPVGRALDSKKPAEGKIFLPDPEGDPTLIKGVDTDFTGKDFQVGGLLVLPTIKSESGNTEIKEIISKTEIRVKKPFKGETALRQLTGQDVRGEDGKVHEAGAEKKMQEGFEGTKFSVAPKVDQSGVYDAVFKRLHEGGCIGIFPEGGSHDRTELLPLKAGVAIMALGALAENPDCGVKIVPCGMNYFHAHKFRSRAVVEFGTPIEIPHDIVEMYKKGERREAVAWVLDTVYQSLVAVTVTSPDYDTLMLIQAVRRLYNPKGKKLPLPMIVELNRRLVKGYTTYKDDPRVVSLKKSILAYNKKLFHLNIRDHQVSYAKFSIPKVIATLLYRIGKITLLSIGVLPGLVLFAPVFIAGKVISIKKSKEALAASTVKIQGRDVVATWKLLVSMALAPLLYTFYTVLFTYWTYRNRVGGRVPESIPLWLIVVLGYIIFPTITYAALRFGEVGMDIVKSLRPLLLSLNPRAGNTLVQLREERARLVEQVTDVINDLGPELYPDFDHQRIITDPFHPLSPSNSRPSTPTHTRSRSRGADSDALTMSPSSPSSPTLKRSSTAGAGIGGGSGQGQGDHQLPRNESFHNLGGFGLFSSRPATPTGRSRSRTNSSSKGTSGSAGFGGGFGGGANGAGLKAMTNIGDKGGFEDLNQKIRGAMRERGRRRKSENEEVFDMVDAGEGLGDVEGEGDGEVKKDV